MIIRHFLLQWGIGLLLGAAAAGAARGAPAAEPVYVVEPCCDLCPLASNRAAYNTKFLSSFTTLVQGQDGWLFRSDDDLLTQFGPDDEGYAGLRRLNDALQRRGVELVIVVQPPRGLMHADKLPRAVRASYARDRARANYAALLNRLRKAGATVPDLSRLIDAPSETEYFFRGDHHWTPDGARRTAALVAETIKTLPLYQSLPKKKFQTVRTGMLAKKGTMQKAATLLCGFGYANQYVDQYATEPVGAEGDLFAEGELPQVVLLGTSNSDSAFNFPGFLSEFLGVDILNEAVTGGGFDGALLNYLPTEEFQKQPPKLLIWEIESYHRLSNRNFYRQVIPRIYNGCASRKPLLKAGAELSGERKEVLFNGGGKVLPLAGKRHLLDIRFADPSVREMRGTVWYTNGSRETLHIKYSDRLDTQGRFVTELRSDPDWGDRVFMSLDMTLPEGMAPGQRVEVTLCERPDAGPATAGAAKRSGKKNRGYY